MDTIASPVDELNSMPVKTDAATASALGLAPEHLADLRKSGLADSTIAACRFKSIRPHDIKAWPSVESAYEIPYFDLDGKPTGYTRRRLFPPRRVNEKDQKYDQDRGTAPQVYMPPTEKWRDIARNSAHPIHGAEGEKKSAALCQSGRSTLGIGGVWNWTEKLEDGTPLVIPTLDQIRWEGRLVELVPDSDVWRPEKQQALQGFYALGMELISRGATVTLVRLPERGQGKVGADDWLVSVGGDARNQWDLLERHALDSPELKHLAAWWQQRRARQLAAAQESVIPDVWPDPQPLVASIAAEPYPLDALPDGIRQAVEEVQSFTQAPTALVAASALATLSLAGQAQISVERSEQLTGPVSLFLLSLAASGERKSTVDSKFSDPIRTFDREQAERAKPDLSRHAAELAAWEAEREGVLTAIKQAAKNADPTDGLTNRLAEIERKRPIAPRVPQLLHGDSTPEHLAYSLAHKYPTAGVLSAEAGLVFGSHGMGTDSLMRNLSLFNTLWDGGSHQIGRRTSESYCVQGVRLTMGLQVQAPTLRNFYERAGDLARGSGWLARFLMAWPESTQGYRPFKDPPATWPSLNAFHRRIAQILNAEGTINKEGILAPAMVRLSPEAKTVWVSFHDAVESMLRTGGELYDIRDVASKISDNAARLAALFHLFCSNCSDCSDCSSSKVSISHMESACCLAAWHLNESRRFFGELALPQEQADAAELDAWLIRYCLQGNVSPIPIRVILQSGPSRLRKKATLLPIAKELATHHRVILMGEKSIVVNPALLSKKEGV